MIMAWMGFQCINFILVSSLLVSQIQETLCSTGTIVKEIICQDHIGLLTCNYLHHIRVVSARYGRYEPGHVYCPHAATSNTDCGFSVLHIIAEQCNNKTVCEVLSSYNGEDPCPGTYKYTEVDYECIQDCTHKKQGMEDGAITNDMITSSSSLEGHSAQEARPISTATGWIPETNNAGQEWIQVKFQFAHLVTGIITEWVYETHVSNTDLSSFNASGKETHPTYQKSFRIEYGPYESALLSTEELTLLNSTKGEVGLRTTNIDPVYTRIFRIIPLSTTLQQFGLKFEILGCNQTSCQCPEDCYHVPQGMVDRGIKTENISMMYFEEMYYNIDNVRLDNNYGIAKDKNKFQWLQVTFDEIHIISGVITKGYSRYHHVLNYHYGDKYVEAFDIELGLEPNNLQRVNQTFNGNTNRNKKEVINIFEAQFSRIFRIIPLSTSSSHYGLRLEILGCYITKSCGCFVGNKNKLQGLMDGRITDRQLSASSQYEMIDGYGPTSARLQSHMDDQSFGCWVPNGMTDEWIQVIFSGTRLLTGVATQGCHSDYTSQWVHEFNIAVGFQGSVLTTLDETFIGNSDANTVVVNVFTPVYANVMRLIPVSTQSIFFGLRFDIYGCRIPDECTNDEFDVRIDNSGFIEIQFNEEDWCRACKDDINDHEADLVCQYLGYSRAETNEYSKDDGYDKTRTFEIHCDDNDYSLLQCDVNKGSKCNSNKYQTVQCDTSISSTETPTFEVSPTYLDSGSSCEEGWKIFQGSCYKFYNRSSQWQIARSSCQSVQADLVVVNNSAVNNFLYNTYNTSVWIGMTYLESEGTFKWMPTGTEPSYTNFRTGEPNNHAGNEDCVELDLTGNGKWNDLPCTRSRNYVCQKEQLLIKIQTTGELCPASVGFNITSRSSQCDAKNTLLIDIHHTITCSGYITGWKFSEFNTNRRNTSLQFCNVRQKLPELATYTIVNCTNINIPPDSSDGRQVVQELSPNNWIAVQAGDRIGMNIINGRIFCDNSGLEAIRLLYLYNNDWVQNGDELAFSSWYARAYSFAAIMDTGCPDLSWTYYNKWCFRSGNVNTRQRGSDDCVNMGAVLMPRFTEFVFLEKFISNNTQVWTANIHEDSGNSSTILCTSVSLLENVFVFQNVSCDMYLLVVCAIDLTPGKGDV